MGSIPFRYTPFRFYFPCWIVHLVHQCTVSRKSTENYGESSKNAPNSHNAWSAHTWRSNSLKCANTVGGGGVGIDGFTGYVGYMYV